MLQLDRVIKFKTGGGVYSETLNYWFAFAGQSWPKNDIHNKLWQREKSFRTHHNNCHKDDDKVAPKTNRIRILTISSVSRSVSCDKDIPMLSHQFSINYTLSSKAGFILGSLLKTI